MGNTTSLVLGFPIRTSSDQSSVGSSPRLIAASYVLLRLLVPRHSPCALKNLANKIAKTSPTRKIERGLFRCSQPLFRSQSPHPTTKQGDNTMCCLRTQQCASIPILLTVRRLADYPSTSITRTDRIYKTYSPSRKPLQKPALCSHAHSAGKWCSLERR